MNKNQWTTLEAALVRMARKGEQPSEVWQRLLKRLGAGSARTRAAAWVEREFEAEVEAHGAREVPPSTWAHFSQCELLDPRSGIVELRGSAAEDNKPLTVTLHGLSVCVADIGDLLEAEPSGVGRRGRPHGNFWPDVAEEMTVYFHECGIPDETTPLSRIAGEILDRMAERGCADIPDAKTVQPSIARVLERLRAC